MILKAKSKNVSMAYKNKILNYGYSSNLGWGYFIINYHQKETTGFTTYIFFINKVFFLSKEPGMHMPQ